MQQAGRHSPGHRFPDPLEGRNIESRQRSGSLPSTQLREARPSCPVKKREAAHPSGILPALTPSQCLLEGPGPAPLCHWAWLPPGGETSLRERLATAVWRAARTPTPQSVIRSSLTTGSFERHAARASPRIVYGMRIRRTLSAAAVQEENRIHRASRISVEDAD